MEKDFLQSLKLEISRKFTLAPYERISFHRILGYQKSDSSVRILLRDLHNGGIVRKSAISVLKDYSNTDVTSAFVDLLLNQEDLSREEFYDIIEHIEKSGLSEHAESLKTFVSRYLDKTDFTEQTARVIYSLGLIGHEDERILSFLRGVITDPTAFEKVRCSALESFIFTAEIDLFEKVLHENNDHLSYSVYRALAGIADREMMKYEESSSDELFTVMPGHDDRVLLDIRVLLGKMSTGFDSYSRETKSSYIMAMILCGHREFIVYTMKALTSDDPMLIDLTLYVILSHTDKFRVPDKLLRSLIGLPSVTSRDSGIVVEIFFRYFSELKESRNNMLFRDKIWNYLIVTLDTFFETYRKNYMIPEIMEKDHVSDVKAVRRLILNRFSPDLKRRILTNLRSEESTDIKRIVGKISESVSFIPDEDDTALSKFIEMILERDQKSREISAARIDDIDFEKRYLKNRIVRICSIIGRLKIEEASSNLVKMFNYVKKYYDEDIYASVTNTLSLLNYPYMLGELELLLVSGDVPEQKRAVKLLPLYQDQRSLNIMLDFVNEHAEDTSEIVKAVMTIILRRDVVRNMAANEVAKKIYSLSKDSEMKRMAMQLVGQTGIEDDIIFLDDEFSKVSDSLIKESIVQAFDSMMRANHDVDRHKITSMLKEYLKDPGIRVRMFSCAILLRMGNQDALMTIRDMMVIKNRNIQRDILLVLGNFMTAEIAFFLLSLLKEDYAISSDIVPLFGFLQSEEMKEIDHFIVNLFKKYEGLGNDSSLTQKVQKKEEEIAGCKKESVSILFIKITNVEMFFSEDTPGELIPVFKHGYSQIINFITSNGGSVSKATIGNIIAYFPQVVSAARSASLIRDEVFDLNNTLPPDYRLSMTGYIGIEEIDIINSEILLPPMREFLLTQNTPVENRVFLTDDTARVAELSFRCDNLPLALFGAGGAAISFRELVSFNNFLVKSEGIISTLEDEERRKREEKQLLEAASKNGSQAFRSKNTIVYAAAMDQVGRVLRRDLMDVSKFISKRSTDRELAKNVDKMLDDVYRNYMLQVSKTTFD